MAVSAPRPESEETDIDRAKIDPMADRSKFRTLVDELRQQKQAMPVGAAVPSERALAVAGHDLIHLATWPARKEID
ncbi:hypothetical protein [Brachybacterium tyrofermentans]|uniref:Uncharacterized protein n=1 Tax=Brachybacterium tyrofermentans TaxID=47848 RepID=A0ABW0FHR6_9MICO